MKEPCQIIIWQVLPVIRKEFAKSLVTQYGFTHRKAAIILGLTEAAVSRYFSGKRGNIDLSNKTILKEINNSASKIAKGNKKIVIQETCRICNLLKSSKFIENIDNCRR
jgi:predicted transcriptional regulator